MECHSSDSKKLFKVFDASKRNRTRKKRDGLDDTNSVATDDSLSVCQPNAGRVTSAKQSLQDMNAGQMEDQQSCNVGKRESSPSVTRSPVDHHRSSRSPRRHRRHPREGISLALKAGVASTPRSVSPTQDADVVAESAQDQDSFIYTYLEEAIKRDKRRHRHSRHREDGRTSREDRRTSREDGRTSHEDRRTSREDGRTSHEDRRTSHEDRRTSRERDASASREHRHHHHHRRKSEVSRDHEKPTKDTNPPATIDQAMLFETFAKLCTQLNDKTQHYSNAPPKEPVPRTLSHKSLQCEVASRRDSYDVANDPVKLRSHERSREMVASKIRSQENFSAGGRRDTHNEERTKDDKCNCYYDKNVPKYTSKLDVSRSRHVVDDRYREYPPVNVPTRTCIEPYRSRPPDNRDYREYDRESRARHYEDDRRKYFEQKTSRSFDVHREPFPDDDRTCRRTTRSDKDRRYEDKRYEDVGKYYEDKPLDPRERGMSKDKRWRRIERFDRNSVVSRDEDYRDRYSERERDSGLSVADGETSTVSGRSNCLKVVKQEIAEQREAMDKMMKLWKELMRCFKGISQSPAQEKAVHDSAANVTESAAAQLRLWRECMRRYETVARDVGDTDARLMEEIKKQRSEMAEMATMWQECLQRYRDMSNDFNNLKQKLATSTESPTRMPAAPLVCAEGEGPPPAPPYHLPHNYPPRAGAGAEALVSGYPPGGSPLRAHASAPPAWWWCDPARGEARSPRRRSSPESRGSRDRDRDRRNRHKDREESRYTKEKSSKPSAARSEHRRRKR